MNMNDEQTAASAAPIKARLLEYLAANKIVKKDFCRLAGISYGNVVGRSMGSELGGGQIAAVLRAAPGLSPDWLLLGEGSVERKPFGGDAGVLADRYGEAQREIAELHMRLSVVLSELSACHRSMSGVVRDPD